MPVRHRLRRSTLLLALLAALLLALPPAHADELLIGSGIRPSALPRSAAPETMEALLEALAGDDDGEDREGSEDETDDSASLSATEYLTQHALGYLGVRYRFGGTSRQSGLDCSGLVLNVFRDALGLQLPRTAGEMARLGEKIARHELQPGDLVFFNTMRRAFSHVGIYLGEGKFVHAPSSGGRVRVEKLANNYWSKHFNGARRLIDAHSSHTEIAQVSPRSRR